MRNIKLTIEYDGTNYNGWQIQKNAPSIQEEIQKAIFQITKEKVTLIGSGRTDAGAHAKGQVANFITKSIIPEDKFVNALNSQLKGDIVIKHSEEKPIEFHSRYDAKSKIYSYTIHKGPVPPAITRQYVYHYRYGNLLCKEDLEKAAKNFIGTFDFKGFMSTGSSVKSTIRTIYDINIVEGEEVLKIFYHGSGFLYNMVRIITGTILNVGIGKIDLESIPTIIKSRERERAGQTVPAHGLCLEKVYY